MYNFQMIGKEQNGSLKAKITQSNQKKAKKELGEEAQKK